jgi:hypothetical protein
MQNMHSQLCYISTGPCSSSKACIGPSKLLFLHHPLPHAVKPSNSHSTGTWDNEYLKQRLPAARRSESKTDSVATCHTPRRVWYKCGLCTTFPQVSLHHHIVRKLPEFIWHSAELKLGDVQFAGPESRSSEPAEHREQRYFMLQRYFGLYVMLTLRIRALGPHAFTAKKLRWLLPSSLRALRL